MTYQHGMYSEFERTITTTPSQSPTIAVYVGTAPVHLIKNYQNYDLVNMPIKLSDINQVKTKAGTSSDWEAFTLCEAFSAHFENGIEPAGPIIAINVLDPAVHKKDTDKTEELTFINNVATVKSDTIVLDSIVLENMVKDTEYTISYDFEQGAALIRNISGQEKAKVNATYSEVDPSKITTTDIIGKANDEGEYQGIGCINLVYTELGMIPNILTVPGYSHIPNVYKAMCQAVRKINGHWDTVAYADIPISGVGTKKEAIKWKQDNEYNDEFTKVCWPKWKSNTGQVYHLSTLLTWRRLLTDAINGGIPYESPSNKPIPTGKQYFGDASANRGYDQQSANELNANGITTAVYWGGETVMWGPHTAAYEYDDRPDHEKRLSPTTMDPRVIFDTSITMLMHTTNSFQEEHAALIDKPMTRAVIDQIKNREQEKADALAAVGAYIGEVKVEFKEDANNAEGYIEGKFVWSFRGTSTPPFKTGILSAAYSTDGFVTYYEGGETA